MRMSEEFGFDEGDRLVVRVMARAAVRLAADHVRHAPPRDWGPGSTVHDAMADAVEELLDRLDDPDVDDRLTRLMLEELGVDR